MILYENTKAGFIKDLSTTCIDEKVRAIYNEKLGRDTSVNERNYWANSLQSMGMILLNKEIPDNAGIAIEYTIPPAQKRIDFIISGYDSKNNNVAIIIELKQWTSTFFTDTEKDGIIKTYLGGHLVETTHPSYQASSYVQCIKDYNENVEKGNIKLFSGAYLHNYELTDNDPLINKFYSKWMKHSPVFTKHDKIELQSFILNEIKNGDDKKTIELIESGKIRPSKSLQDSLVDMIKENKEFIMLDEQKVVYEEILDMVRNISNDRKQVLIVKGGPGTGKSVIAIQLLVKLISMGNTCKYVSKNAAPRNVYLTKLKGQKTENLSVKSLFVSSGCFVDTPKDSIDIVLVDESHRLNKKSGLFSNKGEDQVKELINSAKVSIFFIDEKQRVTLSDSCKIDKIKYWASFYNSKINEIQLTSQFRCNGSDGYLAFIDDILNGTNEKYHRNSYFDIDYDLRIFDDPNKMFELILEKNKINNKARVLAGYCWDWNKNSKNNKDNPDIVIEKFNFKKSWNLGNTDTYIIDEDSVNEIGCIHTSQGLEVDYVGVIIGEDLRYENGKVIVDYTKRAKTDKSLFGIKKMLNEDPDKVNQIIEDVIRNTYRVLLTRGMKGCYICCVDEALGKYMKDRLNEAKEFHHDMINT